jgi:hypothetical protein
MFERIDVLVLRKLTLINFSETSRLFEELAAIFSKGRPSLKLLHVDSQAEQESEELVTSLSSLLSSFQGLQSLRFQCKNCKKLDVGGIVNHGETLKTRFIVNGGIHRQDATRCLVPLDLHKIATACPNLEQLCLNLYKIDEDRDESDILGPQSCVDFTPCEFEKALIVIASIPKLSVLRFTNPPNYRQVFHSTGELLRSFRRSLLSGSERYGFLARATGLLRYLGENGFNVKVLAFSPMETLENAEGLDKHGHFWPHYYYYGRKMKDIKGRSGLVVEPLVDGENEFPNASVLQNDV